MKLAEPYRFIEHHLEYRREIAGRGIDDPQYLGGGGLLLQCLSGFSDEPRILHCNDCLRREILKQCDLLVTEWADFVAIGCNDAEQVMVLPQRHQQLSTDTAD